MSFLNPFSGLQNLGKVPAFLKALKADIKFLFTPDIPMNVKVPTRDQYPDEATHAAAKARLIRQQKFALVRQAVKKQNIRESLWSRFFICYRLLGLFFVFFWMAVIVIYIACMAANPEIYHMMGPTYWWEKAVGLFNRLAG